MVFVSGMQILQLEKRLQDQFQVRCALEKALGYRSSANGDISNVEMPKVTPHFHVIERNSVCYVL